MLVMQNLLIMQHICEIGANYLTCTAGELVYSVNLNSACRIIQESLQQDRQESAETGFQFP